MVTRRWLATASASKFITRVDLFGRMDWSCADHPFFSVAYLILRGMLDDSPRLGKRRKFGRSRGDSARDPAVLIPGMAGRPAAFV